MKVAVINARLGEMSPELKDQVRRMIAEGYGALGISQNSPATLKQANAMFAQVALERTPRATLADAKVILRMALDDSEVSNPDGTRCPLTEATLVKIRWALKY
jgi:hypothetical protein